MEKYIQAPLVESEIKDLQAGDYVYITGKYIRLEMLLISEWMRH